MSEISGTLFGYFDDLNDTVIVPAPPKGVRRLVSSLRIINTDSASTTVSIRLKRIGIVPSGDPLFISVFPSLTVVSGKDTGRSKEVMLTENYDLVGSLASAHTTTPVSFVCIWIDLT